MTKIVNVDLNSFVDWVNEKPQARLVHIEIQMRSSCSSAYAVTKADAEIKVWVYDRGLEVGQFVKSVDEIDLERRKEDEEKSLLAQLKKKYEGGDTA